jgi:predicted RNA-binding Zn ribbon-like protein
MTKIEQIFELSGGALCLDFANTVGDRPRCTREDLRKYEDLLAFGRQTTVLDELAVRRLSRAAKRRPSAARAAFRRAIAFREHLYSIFATLAHGEHPESEHLDALNKMLGRALAHLQVAKIPSGFGWDWSGDDEALDRVLWPIARSAADLLTSNERSQVRQCAADTCSWLFVDRSRTRRRRWCDMKVCGNRAKARRHYQRTKGLKVRTRSD